MERNSRKIWKNDNVSFDNKIKYNEWSEEYMNDFIENFEENKRRKKRKTVAPLDKLSNNEDSYH